MSIQPIAPFFQSYDEAVATLPPESRGEILDGVWTVTPAPSLYHQHIVTQLAYALTAYVKENPDRGIVLVSPVDVVLCDHGAPLVLQPDVVFVAKGAAVEMRPGAIVGGPTLIVEVVLPSSVQKDSIRKRRWYGQYGVIEYWQVWPDDQRIDVLRGGEVEEIGTYGLEDTLESDILPGFRLPLAPVFTKPWESSQG